MRGFVVALLVILSLAAVFPGCAVAQAANGFGVIGDSSSDEFRADDNRGGAYAATTLNWVELLVRYRGLDAGPWGTWGGSRRTGYEYNWARSGARAADLISQGQADGLAQQVAEGRIAWALLMVGTNDFGTSTYTDIYNGTLSGPALSAMIDGIVASITQAVDTVRAGGPVLLLVTNIPTTTGINPAVLSMFPDPARRQLVTDAMVAVNMGIEAALAQRGLPMVDLDALGAGFFARVDASGNMNVGGELISLFVPGDEPHHGLLGDNHHAGTVMQGLIANYFLDHLAAAGGPSIPTFTDAELLANAGILPADTVPPTASIVSPANGAVVSGSVTVTAQATDERGVAGVQFQVDGVSLGPEDTTAPYSATWNSASAAPGPHVLRAVARDAAGNIATAQVTVTVVDGTAPSVTVTSPAGGSQVSGAVTIQASASDNVGVGGVTFYWNGAALGPEVTVAPYRVTVQTNASYNGTVALTATARDTSGNTKTSAPVTITVNNPVPDTTSPSIAFTAPGATVAGTVSVTATASDNVGVAGVRFKLDGNNLGAEDTAAPYNVSWNTTTVANGAHVLTATARDAAGNTTTATRNVTVLNPRTVYPSSYAVVSGTYQSGGVSGLTADDGNYLVVRSTTSNLERTASAELVVAGVTGPVSRLDVRTIVKSSATSTTARIYIYDTTAGAWTQLSSSTIGTSEVTRTSSVSSPARYIDADGSVRLQIQSSRLLSTHSLSVEQVQVTATY
jgi:hypothetical protein